MSFWIKRLGSTLMVVGLIIILICISMSGEDVKKSSITVQAGRVGYITYYLHGNSVKFLIEVIPSKFKVDVLLLDTRSLKTVVEHRNVSSITFEVEHRRGLYLLAIRNISGGTVSVFITRVSRGIQQDILYLGLATLVLGITGVIIGKFLGRV